MSLDAKRLTRAMGDELDEQLSNDQAELDRLTAAAKVVRQRMAATRLQLGEMTGRAPHAGDASSLGALDQSTLDVKRARVAAVRSIGVQVPDGLDWALQRCAVALSIICDIGYTT